MWTNITRVEVCLNGFVNDSVAHAESVEVESHSWEAAVANFLVVLVEQIIEARTVVLR